MKLEGFMLADYVSAEGGKLYVVGVGITRLAVPAFPAAIPTLAVLARFRFEDILDARDRRTATLVVEGPDGAREQFGPIEIEEAPAADSFLEGEEIWANMIMMFGPFFAQEPGVRRFVLSVDDGQNAALSLPIVARSSS